MSSSTRWSQIVCFFGKTMRRYYFIHYVVFVSASLLSECFPFSWFPVQSLIFTTKSLLFTPLSHATYGSTRGTARDAFLGGQGGTCVARRRLQHRTWCYPGVQFNLPARSPIPGPSPAPVPTGDLVAELHGSTVSSTLQW